MITIRPFTDPLSVKEIRSLTLIDEVRISLVEYDRGRAICVQINETYEGVLWGGDIAVDQNPPSTVLFPLVGVSDLLAEKSVVGEQVLFKVETDGEMSPISLSEVSIHLDIYNLSLVIRGGDYTDSYTFVNEGFLRTFMAALKEDGTKN
jgi:hypothetical protein